jgi:hypothetical protein
MSGWRRAILRMLAARRMPSRDPRALAWEMKTRIAIAEQTWEQAAGHLHGALSIVASFAVPVAAWQVMPLRGTSIGLQRMTLPPRGIVRLPKRTFSTLPIPSSAMILFADYSCPHLRCGRFSTKLQPGRSPRYVVNQPSARWTVALCTDSLELSSFTVQTLDTLLTNPVNQPVLHGIKSVCTHAFGYFWNESPAFCG